MITRSTRVATARARAGTAICVLLDFDMLCACIAIVVSISIYTSPMHACRACLVGNDEELCSRKLNYIYKDDRFRWDSSLLRSSGTANKAIKVPSVLKLHIITSEFGQTNIITPFNEKIPLAFGFIHESKKLQSMVELVNKDTSLDSCSCRCKLLAKIAY